MAETILGKTLTLSTGRIIPTRWVGEQHVKEDLGFIPSFADWVKSIGPALDGPDRRGSRRRSIRISPSPWWRSPDMTDPAYQRLGVPARGFALRGPSGSGPGVAPRHARGPRLAGRAQALLSPAFAAHAARQAAAHSSSAADRADHPFIPITVPGLSAGFLIQEVPMADYFTHFSCLLDVGTPDKAARALDLFQGLREEDQDGTIRSSQALPSRSRMRPRAARPSGSMTTTHGDVEAVIRFVLRLAEDLDLAGLWGFDYALCRIRHKAYLCRDQDYAAWPSSRREASTWHTARPAKDY